MHHPDLPTVHNLTAEPLPPAPPLRAEEERVLREINRRISFNNAVLMGPLHQESVEGGVVEVEIAEVVSDNLNRSDRNEDETLSR